MPIDFACEACGKKYALKPEIAGRRVKCKCGHQMTTPTRPADQADDGLYDIADDRAAAPKTPVTPKIPNAIANPSSAPTARPVAAPVTAPMATPMSTSRSAPMSTPVAYRSKPKESRFSTNNMTDVRRDVYIPAAILCLAAVGIVAWALVEFQAGGLGIAFITIFLGIVTVIKTTIMIGLALVFAPMLGVSFGSFWSACFKFAAILIFGDMLILWVDMFIEQAGGSDGRRAGLMVGLLKMMLLAAFISFQCRFMFDMDWEETGQFAVPMAFVSRLLDLGLSILVVALLS